MTPTRALVGLAAVAAAGYVVIHSAGGQGPHYIGDFPSIQEQSQAEPPPVTHVTPGPPVPGPPHYEAQPVAPDAPAPPRSGPRGPGAIPSAAPPGGGGTGSRGGYPPPGVGSPLNSGLTPLTDLLSGLTSSLPTFDPQGFCRLTTGKVVALPCDQIPDPTDVVPTG
jgi:hypothetical protein